MKYNAEQDYSRKEIVMHNNATRRYFTLIVIMYLTAMLGLSVVTATQQTTNSSQVVAGQKESPASTKHSTPKRHPIVSTKKQARLWMLQKIDAPLSEWLCAKEIIHRESRWTPNLWNTQGSTAYGLGQVKGSFNYTKNKPLKQFKVALRYMIHKHTTACDALDFHDDNGWY
jgi:hypothetical protein